LYEFFVHNVDVFVLLEIPQNFCI